MGKLNVGMQDYRGESCLFALISVIAGKNPEFSKDQLFEAVKKHCLDIHDLAERLPNLGAKLYEIVSKENAEEIKAAVEAMAQVSGAVAQLVGSAVATVVFSAKLSIDLYRNMDSLKRSWNALEGAPIPEGMESRWTKTMSKIDKVQAGVGAFMGVFGASMEIWQAIKTAEQKDEALATIAKNRDAIRTFYDSVMSHVH
jgi:hypothetical protein